MHECTYTCMPIMWRTMSQPVGFGMSAMYEDPSLATMPGGLDYVPPPIPTENPSAAPGAPAQQAQQQQQAQQATALAQAPAPQTETVPRTVPAPAPAARGPTGRPLDTHRAPAAEGYGQLDDSDTESNASDDPLTRAQSVPVYRAPA